jgi:hypothetical protein
MTGVEIPQKSVVGMSLADARAYLQRHGLKAVVSRRDGVWVSGVDLAAPGQVLLAAQGETVVAVEGRT